MKFNPLLCLLATLTGPLFAISSNAQEEISFGYDCGTGCYVKVRMTSDVESISLPDGKQVNTAIFLQEQLFNGRRNTSDTVQYFASCDTKEIAFSDEDTLPEEDSWRELIGDDRDYTTVAAGMGHYFDALCK